MHACICVFAHNYTYIFVCLCMCTCASDLGYNRSSFSGIEQGESHKVQVTFFSGGIDSGIIFNVRLDLSGTASKCDNVIVRLLLYSYL